MSSLWHLKCQTCCYVLVQQLPRRWQMVLSSVLIKRLTVIKQISQLITVFLKFLLLWSWSIILVIVFRYSFGLKCMKVTKEKLLCPILLTAGFRIYESVTSNINFSESILGDTDECFLHSEKTRIFTFISRCRHYIWVMFSYIL